MSAERIRLARVLTGSRANGPGLRDVYWTTGCSIRCPGCINPHYLEAAAGKEVELKAVEELIRRRAGDIEGITFSGGEPTDQAVAVSRLSAFARGVGLSVLIFTGRTRSECQEHTTWRLVLENCDILVAGRYVDTLRKRTGPLIGSTNQLVHFLSNRYCKNDLREIPDLEMKMSADRIAVTGVYLPSKT